MHALAQQVQLDFLGVSVCSLLLVVQTLGPINHGVLGLRWMGRWWSAP
ncbi:hypothetical protein [Stenotrophomonas nitritireducens]